LVFSINLGALMVWVCILWTAGDFSVIVIDSKDADQPLDKITQFPKVWSIHFFFHSHSSWLLNNRPDCEQSTNCT
jgi:hypothetical protein